MDRQAFRAGKEDAHSDKGLKIHAVQKIFIRMGVEFTTFSSYKPSSNLVTERLKRMLLDITQAMLTEAGINEVFLQLGHGSRDIPPYQKSHTLTRK